MSTHKRRSRQRIAVLAASAVAVAAIVGSGVWLGRMAFIAPTNPSAPQPTATSVPRTTQPTAVQPPTTVALPASLQIPSINVNHALSTVGLNADGTLQVPPLSDVAVPAWYTGSPRPGAVGPTVVIGHVDSASQGAGVFYRLGALHVGAQIKITRADNTVANFVVYDVVSIAKASFPTASVYGNTAGPELRLITCGGKFDRATGHYLNNTIVFARAL